MLWKYHRPVRASHSVRKLTAPNSELLQLFLCLMFESPLCSFSPLPDTLSSSAANSCYGCSEAGSVTIEGLLRRKTLLKEGRKPRVKRSEITLWFKLLSFHPAANGYLVTAVRCFQHVHLSAVLQLSSWTRFWITLSGSTLTFYGAKALRASERKHVGFCFKNRENMKQARHKSAVFDI